LVFRLTRPLWRDPRNQPRLEENHPRRPRPAPVESPTDIAKATEAYLKFGNPSGATTDASYPNNYLLVNRAFALSYNRERGSANWVSWRVTPTDLGDVRRSDDFRPDVRLPQGWTRVLPTDYTRSGFTRGHLCPAGDRSADEDANSATFLMTNIVPQTADSNQGVWLTLEEYCRSFVQNGATLYVIAGVYGEQRRIRDRVTAPTNLWKVVVVLPEDSVFDGTLPPDARVIAIDTPNINGVRYEDWSRYRTTVRAIEQASGYDLLSGLTREDQERVENRMDQ
jgi:endonuclease G